MGGKAKYAVIAKGLRRRITAGELPVGSRVPSENELAAAHGVHRLTARRALDELTQTGLLERVRGSGTFVAARMPRSVLPVTGCVGLLMRGSGHVWFDAAYHLARELQQRDMLALLVDLTTMADGDCDRATAAASAVQRALASDLGALVLDATYLRYIAAAAPELAERREVVSFGDATASLREVGFPYAHTVYSDARHGGRLLTEHLLDEGHQRFLLCSFGYPPRRPGDPPRLNREIHQRRFRAGCRDALRDAGLDPGECLRLMTGQDDPGATLPNIDTVFARCDRPTAVLAMGDWRARMFYDAARRHGLSIGRDVAIVGYYDTPWATAYRPQLTSVNIDVATLAARAAEIIAGFRTDPGLSPRHILVKPRLVVRASSIVSSTTYSLPTS